ncbi:MAG: ADP-ribosylglycohydrolase family protein [Acidimicrobiia bacterium]
MRDGRSESQIRHRSVGCLLGLAVGDALGAAVEFQPPGTFTPVSTMRAGGPHGLAAGQWTDDTSMALALADSLLTVGWDPDDQARRYVDWWRNGTYSVNGECFDIGGTTAAALRRFESGYDASLSGLKDPASAGNGSIMRLAPVAIATAHRFPDDLAGLVDRCIASSLPTHRSAQATSACAVLGVMLAALIAGEERSTVTDPGWGIWADVRRLVKLHPEIDGVVSGSYRSLRPPDIVGSGYVVKSLESALWAFDRHDDLRSAVLAAVNLGNDADTTGAVCGQLAGACWGVGGIEESWLEVLARNSEIVSVADGLARLRI